ncbi:glycosyltransferase family 2 protein [Geomonas sp. RF6]|uniref:glycosyltransferase family 2 protein n=1 Tax=Geomonas sp. RF6 TaxID=2897342 RepID=UPI001E4CF395|nr:glycosyltransferase family A protein [Geomonas sp. RF6]UFS71081.1 glycosyltransferase family 2 protein [Geomonas sp. RF6]
MPQLSVIIPTYNRARYLTKALDSVLAQEWSDCEIIVVDDGSRDATRAALEPYRERIRYIYQENAGVSAARNRGIRAATGTWVAFLDSDDEWRRGYLAEQMESVRRFPEAVASIKNSICISLDGRCADDHFAELGVLKLFGEQEEILLERAFRTVVGSSHWFLQGIVVRRETLLEAGLFNPALSIAEDMDLVARLALRGAFVLSRKVLVEIYRREEDGGSLSAQYMNRGIYSRESFAKVFSDLMSLPGVTLPDRIVLRSSIGTMWRALGNICLASGRVREARQYYLKSLAVHPSLKGVVKCLAAYLPRGVALLAVRKRVNVVPGDEAELR